MKRVLVSLIVTLAITNSQCAKILGVFPIAAPSHYFLGSALMKGLAEKGHDVTIITPYLEKNPPLKGSYREIYLSGFEEESIKLLKEMVLLDRGDPNPILFVPFIMSHLMKHTEDTLAHENVQAFLNSNETFDLVIAEIFLNYAHIGFATHYNVPLILLNSIGASYWINDFLGNPSPSSYISDPLIGFSSHMTFCERVKNTLMTIFTRSLVHFYELTGQEKIFDKYFPSNKSLFYDTIYNVSIVLLNSHPSTNQPVPYVPNMVDIGGFHIQPSKKLPEDLQKFLDDSKEGVIYFSLGSNIRSADLPPEKRDAFLKVFSQLKQKVLWKWEDDAPPGQPDNVKPGKWLPQQEILAHPNIKLFITHGGLPSTTETIYHGVPALAIPIAAEQKLNAQKIVQEGCGVKLSYSDISEETLTKGLREVLDNPRYTQNAKKRSQLFHDRPVKPLDVATYWVEYVIRHGGAPHLRVAGVDLPWYQYMLLDVIAFLALSILLGFYITYKISQKFCKKWCSKSSEEQKIKKH